MAAASIHHHLQRTLVAIAFAVVATSANAAFLDKPSVFGNPAQILQQPRFAPPPQQTLPAAPESTSPTQSFNVPSTQIGLQNPTDSNVAAVIDLGPDQHRVVLLKAFQSETIDCRACTGPVKATVPRGSTPQPNDFSMTVTPGHVYRFRYETGSGRWILEQQ